MCVFGEFNILASLSFASGCIRLDNYTCILIHKGVHKIFSSGYILECVSGRGAHRAISFKTVHQLSANDRQKLWLVG